MAGGLDRSEGIEAAERAIGAAVGQIPKSTVENVHEPVAETPAAERGPDPVQFGAGIEARAKGALLDYEQHAQRYSRLLNFIVGTLRVGPADLFGTLFGVSIPLSYRDYRGTRMIGTALVLRALGFRLDLSALQAELPRLLEDEVARPVLARAAGLAKAIYEGREPVRTRALRHRNRLKVLLLSLSDAAKIGVRYVLERPQLALLYSLNLLEESDLRRLIPEPYDDIDVAKRAQVRATRYLAKLKAGKLSQGDLAELNRGVPPIRVQNVRNGKYVYQVQVLDYRGGAESDPWNFVFVEYLTSVCGYDPCGKLFKPAKRAFPKFCSARHYLLERPRLPELVVSHRESQQKYKRQNRRMSH